MSAQNVNSGSLQVVSDCGRFFLCYEGHLAKITGVILLCS